MSVATDRWTSYRTLGDDALVFRALIVLLIVLYSALPPASGEQSSWINYAVIAVYILSTLYLNRRESELGKIRGWLPFAGYALDIGVITFTLNSLRAWESELYLTYVVVILISVKAVNLRHNLIVGLAVCAAYSLALLHHPHVRAVLDSSFLIRFPFLVIVSVFTLLMTQKLEKARDGLRQVNARLRDTNEQLEDKMAEGTRDLRQAHDRLQLMNDITQSAMRLDTLEQLWPMLADKLRAALGCERATFFVQDESGALDSIYADGLRDPIHLPKGKGIAGRGSRMKKPIIINEPYEDPDFAVKVDVTSGFRTRNILACPLVDDEEVSGVAEFLNKEGGFPQKDADTLVYLAPGIQIIYDKLKGDSQRASMQAALMRTDKLAVLGRLMAGLSHEIRNPMTTILANAQLMLRRPYPPEESKEMLEDIESCVKHSVDLLNDLLIFSRKDPKGLDPHCVDDIIERSLKLLGKRFEISGIELVKKLDTDSPNILCDASQLQQVILNILSNAQQVMAGGGTLTLTTSVSAKDAFLSQRTKNINDSGAMPATLSNTNPGRLKRPRSENTPSYVVLDIDDTGPGLTPEVLKRLFEPFFTTKETGKGTGLGLSVSKEIIEQHNGLLIAGDNPAGKGARFTIALPLLRK